MIMLPTTLPLLLAFSTTIYHALAATPIVSAVGSKFFTSDGNQFYIKGASRDYDHADTAAIC